MHVDPSSQTLCPVCGETVVERIWVNAPPQGADNYVNCHFCGHFYIDHMLPYNLNSEQPSTRYRLSGAIREMGRKCPVLLPQTFGSCLAVAPRDYDVAEKSRRLLARLARKSQQLGHEISIEVCDAALGYSHTSRELYYLFDYLRELGCIGERHGPALAPVTQTNPKVELFAGVVITPAGWEALSSRPAGNSDAGFVAMWFSDATASAWTDAIRPALEDDCGWKATRIDLEEHNDDIVDKILGSIRSSRFVVADFTGHRNGVYFEAGFAKGLGIPVIWVCKEDAIKEAHFDTSHFSHVLWETPEDLRVKLANRILSTIGEGSFRPPLT